MGSVGAAPRRDLTLDDAKAVQKMYTELFHLDSIAFSMRHKLDSAARYWKSRKSDADPSTDRLCGSPLHKVTFAGRCGPEDFEPTITARSIGKLVLKDILFQRAMMASQIEALGFVAPKPDKKG